MKNQQLFIKLLIVSLLSGAISTPSVYAQRRDSTYFNNAPINCLKPIVIGANNRYYYDSRRLRSGQSLEIPFGELDDPTVNKHYKNARIMRGIGGALSIAPTIYWLTTLRSNYNRSTFWTIYIGSLVSSVTLALTAEGQVRKAVRAYNNRIGNVKLGLAVENLPNNQFATGIGISAKF